MKKSIMKKSLCSAFAFLMASAPASLAVATMIERNVQFTEVDFESSTITLTNLSASDSVDLSGWRFCSHDDNQIRRYSNSFALNGESLMPGESLTVHFNNDGEPAAGTIDISSLGTSNPFALAFDRGPYSISIYSSNPVFSNGDFIVDHIQWSIDGADNIVADERSDEAQGAGLWSDQNEWITTTSETASLLLTNPDGSAILQGASDYTVVPIPEPSALILTGLSATLLLRRRRR